MSAELTPQQAAWDELTHRADALVELQPDDPVGIASTMHEVEVLLLDIARLLAQLNHDRYEAERAWMMTKNVTMGRYLSHGATFARAQAEVAAVDDRKRADDLKVIYHHAEDTQRALQQKHYGLMNINKGLQSAMFEGGRRG